MAVHIRFVVSILCFSFLGLGQLLLPASATAKELAEQRIVFLGDSITHAGDRPGGYVSLVREAIGGDKVKVIGAGIGGNRVPDLQKRLQKDVLDENPTTVVIYIGINDVWHSEKGRGTSKEDFESGLKEIIGKIKDKGASVILCTATMIGEKTDGSNKLDGMLEEYCAISRKVATDTGSKMVDLRKAFVDYLKENNTENKDKGILTSDTVHLNAAGNQFLANQMLAGLGHADAGKILRHVVMFKFKDDLAAAEVQKIVDAFAELPSKIDTIVDFEHGTNVSPEGKSEGLTHGFTLTFRDQAGIDAYLPHPAHKEFGGMLGGKIDKVLVFDYWTPRW